MEEERASTPALICQISNLPDEGIDLEGDVTFEELDIESDYRFTLDRPMHYRLHVSLAKQAVVVTGRLSATVTAICDRCAEPADLKLEVNDVLHTYKNILGQPIDLTEEVREDILLSFPQSFHCSEDCKGICPTCGKNLNEGPCGCGKQADDDAKENNPWSVLDNLKL